MSRFHGFRPAPLALPMVNNCASLSASSASSASSHPLKRNEKTWLMHQLCELPRWENMRKQKKQQKRRKQTPWFGSFPCHFSEGHSRPDESVDSHAKQ
jgi:hypothetical protein